MRRPLIALLLVLSGALGACATAAPGWTYAPPTVPPAVTPAPSGAPSEAPASEAPSGEAPSDGGAGGGGEVVKEVAKGIAFVNKALAAPADAPWQLEFDNQDAGMPHNIEIRGPNGASVFKGELFNGAAIKVYDVPALAAGDYTFICSVHPNMTGTLKVGG